MIIVLDASAAVSVVLDKDKTLIQPLLEADKIIAPVLFISEIGNVFLKYHQFRDMKKSECLTHIKNCLGLITDFYNEQNLYEEAFSIAYKNKLSYYDALYLAIAVDMQGTLLTLDKKLRKIASELKLS